MKSAFLRVCKQLVRFAKRSNTLGLGPILPLAGHRELESCARSQGRIWPTQGVFLQQEFLFGNQDRRSGRAEGTRLLRVSPPTPESKTKLPITRKNHPRSDHLCLPIDPRGESCNCIRLLSCSESISLSRCVQHVDTEKTGHGPRGQSKPQKELHRSPSLHQ